MIPLKNQLIRLISDTHHTSSLSKRQTDNEIRYHQTLGSQAINTRKRDKKHPDPPLKGHKTPSAPLRPAPFTLLSTHLRTPESRHQYLIGEGFCGKMNTLVADSGGNKGQFSLLVEAVL